MKSFLFFLLVFTALLSTVARADAQVDVSGGDAALNENVRNHIGSLRDRDLHQPRRLQRRLRKLIQPAAEALGYYDLQFELSVESNIARIKLQPGEPVRWNPPHVIIVGDAATLKPIATRVQNAPIKSGEVLNQGLYDQFKRNLLDSCRDYGFLDARYVTSALRVDLNSHRATADLDLDCGERYHFRQPSFVNSELDADLIDRLSPIEAGAPYRKSDISKLYRSLLSSRYFSDVDVATTPDANTKEVALTVSLTDAPRNRFTIGVGYGTDTGARLRLGWSRPIVNSAGHSFDMETTLTNPIQNFTADYRIPLNKPLDEFISVPVEFERKVIEDTDSTLGSVGLFYNDAFNTYWHGRAGANFEVESYQQGSEPRKNVEYLVPGVALTRQVLPEGIDPVSGNKTWMEAWASAPALGADTAFLRVNIGHKHLFNPWGSQLLILRGEVGAIATDNIFEIPASQRFFTGGDTTVRGFDYESLSTRDADNQLIGGQYLNVASAEYSVKVQPSWRAAVFVDAGRAFNDVSEDWHESAGFGARWLSPIGQIRIDLAFPINEPDLGWRLHIFIGPPL